MAVRVGFLGAGLIAASHSVSLGRSGTDYVRTGVFDPDQARCERFAAATSSTACGSEDEVLDGCEAVYVCTWTSEHPRLVSSACERGLAVFCEKPLATDLAGARAMADAVARAGVVNQVGLVLRRAPAVGMLRALAVDTERCGRPMAIVFRDDQYIPIQGMYASTWRGEVDKAGSGVLLEHSIHDIDLLEHVMGPITSVSASLSNLHAIEGIEDGAAVTLRFASGALGTLLTVWHDVLERPSQRRIELFSERCMTVVDGEWAGPVTWQLTGEEPCSSSGDELAAEATARGATLGNEDGAFIEAVAAGTSAWPSFADAVRAHEVADAIYRAARTGTVVEV